MSNIVAFKPKAQPVEIPAVVPNNSTPDSVMDMVYDIQVWAMDNGIDINTLDFKYSAATIMSVLQGMVFKVENN
jgi:hypothetical protein